MTRIVRTESTRLEIPHSGRDTSVPAAPAPTSPTLGTSAKSATGLSPAGRSIVQALTAQEAAIEPARFPKDRDDAHHPGMYSWWGDDEACAVLSDQIGVQIPPLLYVGQAGAIKHRSRTTSAATLASRIGRQHIRGNARSSTFRLTITSLLLEVLDLTPTAGRKLDRTSNSRVSAWIAEHLRVAIAPVDDREALAELEKEVVRHLDPPLNLAHCPPSNTRALISQRRRVLGS